MINREQCQKEYDSLDRYLFLLGTDDDKGRTIIDAYFADIMNTALQHGFALSDEFMQGFATAQMSWHITHDDAGNKPAASMAAVLAREAFRRILKG